MKKIYLIITLLSCFLGFSQPPVGYYSAATGTGYALKTQLKTIITTGYIDRGYSGLWTTYSTSDVDSGFPTGAGYENDNSVYDMYSENPTGSSNECNFVFGTNQDMGSGGTSECQFYNREHIIPQSIFNQVSPERNDAHFIPPADKKVNNVRGNEPHGNVAIASYTANNGGKFGSSAVPGFIGDVFEPNSAFKGDIARMYFYFATRYEVSVASYPVSYAMFNNTSSQVFTNNFLQMLLTWNANDPVSAFEIKRNNAIYARQNNRNPFIDNNAYVTAIWGSPLAVESFELIADINVYPNPSSDQKINIETENELDEIQIINVNGQIMQQISKPTKNDNKYTVDNLNQGFYFLKLSSENKSIVKKIVIN
jgi:endonuclease I